jgi:hypothetical protein
MAIPTSLRNWLPSAALGAAAFTLTSETAHAFFPPLPVGSTTVTVSPPPPVFVPPTIPIPPPVIPPVSPPPFNPPSPPPQTVDPQGNCDCDCPTRPQATPEPATIVSSAIGLVVVAGAAWRRRKKS